MKHKTKYLALFSDPHAGHRLGLVRPGIKLSPHGSSGDDKPFIPELTEAQRLLWKYNKQWIGDALNWAGKNEVILIQNGDGAQGLKHKQQLMSNRLSDQVEIGTDNLLEWKRQDKRKRIKKVRVLASTPSHAFEESSADILIAESVRNKSIWDVRTYYHGLISVGGVVFDIAHKGPGQSSRFWLEGNTARYYTKDIMLKNLAAGRKPPDVIIRSHFHTWVNTIVEVTVGNVDHFSRLIVTPAMSLLGEYAKNVTRNIPDFMFGMVVFKIENGQVQVRKFSHVVDTRIEEEL